MRKTRYLALLMYVALLATLLGGCSGTQKTAVEDDRTRNIYASFYPFYAIAQMLAEDVPNLQVNCLVQPQDGCLRDYALSDWDLALLTRSADAVIIGGRGLESFESLLFSLGEDGPAISAVLYNMELQDFGFEDAAEDSHWKGEDLHIFMTCDGAMQIAERIAASLIVYDAENMDIYEQNLEKLNNRLKSVSDEIQTSVASLANSPVIVMNEALAYTAEECGLQIVEYVDRDSGEAYYDAELERCLEKLEGCSAKVILIERQAPEAFCRVLEEAGYVLAKLDTLSTRRADEGAEVYLEVLTANSAAIKEAFAVATEVSA